ncbi:MAG: M13 family metallopeptidase [Bdellovibrionaceae bacterium]|nr:M13 family metallopeptidase [Pseudobdellovibrionaceae bacterium]
MKTKLSLIAFAASVILTGCLNSGKKVTAEKLYEGLSIPQQREFPLSQKVGACEDFHQYVCSEVENAFKLPDDRERWIFSFSDNAEKLLHAKKKFFENINDFKPKNKRGQQFKSTYTACMNTEEARKEEVAYVKEEVALLSKIQSWEELAQLSQARVDQGLEAFTYFGPIANKENPLLNDVFIVSDMRTLPERSYYTKADLMSEFKKILMEFFTTIGMDDVEKRAQFVLDFEKALALKAPLPSEIRGRFAEKREISREDFLAKYPNLMFERMLEQVPANIVLIDVVPETNEFINKALAESPLEQLKSVYAFHSLVDYLDDSYPEFFQKYFDFKHKFLGGPAVRSERHERCTKLVMGQFGMELDYELLDILFPHFPQDRAIKVGETVREAIIKGLENNTWLSDSTKEEAIKKIKFAKLHLVKPLKDKDWNFMPIKKYSDTEVYANARLYKKTRIEKVLSELKEPRNPDRWWMSPLYVNAYYSSSDNKFVLPQGILQFPFFSADLSDIENIAAIGTVVGHELGHGIDDKGSDYDFEGKVRKWFTDADLKTFKSRGAKFIKQFDKIGHDGKLTLGENIGDHVGITFSHDAAFAGVEKASKEDQQKFFVAYARMWCGVATPSYIERQLKTDPHALGKERINQQVIHHNGFYEAFGCTPKDKMYLAPKDRIRVW